ncbi:hypothetical protein PInf_014239 [Phytophthora infestans]|nr:hypothetical protein PInf_014239 [Phytophthora infestans]
MLVTLGIEKDDDSDEDFVLDYMEEDNEEEEEDLPFSVSDAEITQKAGKTFGFNHTHTHPTSQTEASSYLTTKTLPLDDRDLEDVTTLADARVSSAHITNFLNDRIDA